MSVKSIVSSRCFCFPFFVLKYERSMHVRSLAPYRTLADTAMFTYRAAHLSTVANLTFVVSVLRGRVLEQRILTEVSLKSFPGCTSRAWSRISASKSVFFRQHFEKFTVCECVRALPLPHPPPRPPSVDVTPEGIRDGCSLSGRMEECLVH
jgi:hypothetical protein